MISNNIILFNLYIGFIFIFLILLSIFLSNYIVKIFYLLIKNNQFIDIIKLQKKDIYVLIDNYIKQKKWLLCISLLELCNNLNFLDQWFINQYLAYSYEQLNHFSISIYYYKISLDINPNNLVILQKLLFIYKMLDDYKSLEYIAKCIFS